MLKPSPTFSSVTVAVVSSFCAVRPALPSCAESAMVKQPACAAASNSSGLVPTPFSKRVLKEYCVCFSTPLSVEMVPFPSFKPPCQTADALRCMVSLLLARSFFLNPQNSIPVLLGRVYSENDLAYRDANVIKIIGRNGEPIFMQCENITFYGFANILNGVLFCFSLADTSGKPRTFCDPVANLTGIEDYPSHRISSRESLPRASHVQRKGNEVRARWWRKRRQLRAVDRMIERIALNRNAAGGADQAFQFIARRELRRFRARVVINLLLYHRAVEVVRAEAQRDLRDARREHDPVRLDVLEIVEQQPRHGDVAQVVVARRLRNVRERGVIRMKRQRDERHEAVGLVLQLAQLDEVVDALLLRFHVPVKHRRIRAQPDFMRLPSNVEPHLSADFVIAYDLAHTRMKNFGAAAGQRIDSCFFQLEQRFFDG